jgi:Family of unknown function (DUF5343)
MAIRIFVVAEKKLPYLQAYGNITKALSKIQSASTPSRFTQDFLVTKLGMSGGSATPLIPFLKRTGFLGSDGSPTELYKQFRNPSQSGAAVAEALRVGYGPLYEVNEYVHDLDDKDLMGLVVQITGSEGKSKLVRSIVSSFKALKEFADFDTPLADPDAPAPTAPAEAPQIGTAGVNLGYTINLNLPATSDVAVFNAIFKSLREHLLPQ